MIRRKPYLDLWNELSSEKGMVFLSGPRQIGKTTLAKEIARGFKNRSYMNWDILKHKKQILADPGFFQNMNRQDASMPLVVFDEIHKYRQWKNYLKGIYDEFSQDYKFLVSGSGRLDLYRKGGDSLAGRYFQFHLLPFTVAELSGKQRDFQDFMEAPLQCFSASHNKQACNAWDTLFHLGGFPEPFVKGTRTFYAKWINSYMSQVLREDIRSLFDIKHVDQVEILFSLLPSKVGSPLSVNNLSADLQASHGSVKSWLRILEVFYLAFRISPWSRKISRAILKEQKLYLFHYAEAAHPAARFENMVAMELLRAVLNWNEHGYGRFSLHYVRTKEKEEVDFLIADKNVPFLLVETKLSDDALSKSLTKFQNILDIPAVQLVNKNGVLKVIKNNGNKILVTTAYSWLCLLP